MTTKKTKKQLEQENIELKKQIENLKKQEELQNEIVNDKKEYNALLDIEDSKLTPEQKKVKVGLEKDLQKWERKTHKVTFVVLKKDKDVILLNTSTSYIDMGKMVGDKYLSIIRPMWRWPMLILCYCSLFLAPVFYIELNKNSGQVNHPGLLRVLNRHGYKPYSKDDAIRIYRLLPQSQVDKSVYSEFEFEEIKKEYHKIVSTNIANRKKELKVANKK